MRIWDVFIWDGTCNELQRTSNGQVSFIPQTSLVVVQQSRKEALVGLCSKSEPRTGIGCPQQLALPPTALPRAQSSIEDSDLRITSGIRIK